MAVSLGGSSVDVPCQICDFHKVLELIGDERNEAVA
jgi:hypothetical protein